MPAYLIFTRERTRNQAEYDQYHHLVGPTLAGHPVTVRAIGTRTETLEGPTPEETILLEFPTREDALAWYNSPAYESARQHRFLGADYRCLLVDGVPGK
jgi:uncharacterized protein (DUF1330 family)